MQQYLTLSHYKYRKACLDCLCQLSHTFFFFFMICTWHRKLTITSLTCKTIQDLEDIIEADYPIYHFFTSFLNSKILRKKETKKILSAVLKSMLTSPHNNIHTLQDKEQVVKLTQLTNKKYLPEVGGPLAHSNIKLTQNISCTFFQIF